MPTDNAYVAKEADVDQDELYLYGEMTFESRQPWQLDESSLTLVDHVTKESSPTSTKLT